MKLQIFQQFEITQILKESRSVAGRVIGYQAKRCWGNDRLEARTKRELKDLIKSFHKKGRRPCV